MSLASSIHLLGSCSKHAPSFGMQHQTVAKFACVTTVEVQLPIAERAVSPGSNPRSIKTGSFQVVMDANASILVGMS